mmetsp:Transcript_41732/g.78041  ORF Transcript_41732/g.78041 Transcript_41732/m.78041 type:complete len:280 (-) Transcript_41732:543-1382(-)
MRMSGKHSRSLPLWKTNMLLLKIRVWQRRKRPSQIQRETSSRTGMGMSGSMKKKTETASRQLDLRKTMAVRIMLVSAVCKIIWRLSIRQLPISGCLRGVRCCVSNCRTWRTARSLSDAGACEPCSWSCILTSSRRSCGSRHSNSSSWCSANGRLWHRLGNLGPAKLQALRHHGRSSSAGEVKRTASATQLKPGSARKLGDGRSTSKVQSRSKSKRKRRKRRRKNQKRMKMKRRTLTAIGTRIAFSRLYSNSNGMSRLSWRKSRHIEERVTSWRHLGTSP